MHKMPLIKMVFPGLGKYSKLYLISGGIPGIKWSGVNADDNVLVLDLLGPSLEDLFVYCGRKFSLKTVLMLADQMVIAYSEFRNLVFFLHVRTFELLCSVGVLIICLM